MVANNNGNNNNQSFIISNYLELLTNSKKEKGKYICPICEGHNLSIDKSGIKYKCFDGCTGKQIAYRLRELNGEFSQRKALQDESLELTYSSENQINKGILPVIETKLKTSMDVLAFIRATYGNRIAFNVRTQKIEIDNVEIPADCIRMMIADKQNIDVDKDKLLEAFLYLALQNQYDPVKKYLEQVSQTIEPLNLNCLSTIFFGTAKEIYDVYLKCWLIGCVARVFQPGCKFDEALVLQGATGTGKSTFFDILGGDYFSDSMTPALDKDDKTILSRNLIIEWGELDGFTAKNYHGKIKHFLSRRVDEYRLPYAKSVMDFPRRSVITGTTNRDDFLNDPTGNRRFWVIPVAQEIPLDAVEEQRDSIWAGAVLAYHNGESWKLPRKLWNVQAEENKNYEQSDPWEAVIEPILEANKDPDITTSELLKKLEHAGYPVNYSRADEMRLRDILQKLGCKATRKYRGTKQIRVWVKPES